MRTMALSRPTARSPVPVATDTTVIYPHPALPSAYQPDEELAARVLAACRRLGRPATVGEVASYLPWQDTVGVAAVAVADLLSHRVLMASGDQDDLDQIVRWAKGARPIRHTRVVKLLMIGPAWHGRDTLIHSWCEPRHVRLSAGRAVLGSVPISEELHLMVQAVPWLRPEDPGWGDVRRHAVAAIAVADLSHPPPRVLRELVDDLPTGVVTTDPCLARTTWALPEQTAVIQADLNTPATARLVLADLITPLLGEHP